MAVYVDAGGQTIGTKHIATVRLQGESTLDVEVVSDGSKTVLDLIKETATSLIETTAGDDLNWSELKAVPAEGEVVKISIGALAERSE